MPPPRFAGPFLEDARTRAAYSEGAGIYRIVPRAVAIPRDQADVLTLIQWAREEGVPLVPRGAGSAVTGSSVGEGVVVDLSQLPPFIEIDPAGRARTAPSVRAAELDQAAASHGLRLPPDPSSARFATLGGMVSTNASGARSVKYGSVRRWVEGIEMVTGRGEVLRLSRGSDPEPGDSETVRRFDREVAPALRAAAGLITRTAPATRKNSSGYALDAWLQSGDLLDLVIGSEGTLGIITGIHWRLDRVPAERAGLQVTLASLDDLAPAVEALLPLEPSALELLDRSFLQLVRAHRPDVAPASTEAVLLLEFEGQDSSELRGRVGDAVRRMKHLALDLVTGVTVEDQARIWALRHAASPIIADLPDGRRSLQVIEDACVPLPGMAEYIQAVRAAAAELGIPVVIFGHAGDGNIHVNLLPDVTVPGWENDVLQVFDRVSRAVIRLGGTPSGEHGDGRLRSGLLRARFGGDLVDLFHRVKQAFDPAGIMNPGVKLQAGGHAGPLDRLKAGMSAAPIPDDIAATLREIERTGDYRRDRRRIADQENIPRG